MIDALCICVTAYMAYVAGYRLGRIRGMNEGQQDQPPRKLP